MWNSSSLVAPVVYTFKATSPLIDISAVASVINNAIKVLNSQNTLELESKLLSRCVYRMKLKFRNDKGFKIMEKTVTVLKSVLHFDILNDLKVFLNALPKKYEKDFYLPTKQMLEYILVRLQGFSKLLCRVVESSKSVAEFMHCRLQLGHFWTTAAVILALISRIWQITKFLTEKCCSWFNTLLPLRDKFEINGVKWLPDDYVFPTDLVEWLNVGWLFEKPHIFNKLQFDLPIFSLLDDSDDEVEFCSQYKLNDCFVVEDGTFVDNDVQIIGGNLTKVKKEEEKSLILIDDESDIETTNNPFICDNTDDIGESVSRKTISIELDNDIGESPIEIDNDIGESSNLATIKIDTDADASSDESIIIVDSQSIMSPMCIDDDIGESISRKRKISQIKSNSPVISVPNNETTTKLSKKKKKKLKNKMDQLNVPLSAATKSKLCTLKELHRFLKYENAMRRNDLQQCFTKNISDQRWIQLYTHMSMLKVNAEINSQKLNNYLLRARVALQKALNEVSHI